MSTLFERLSSSNMQEYREALEDLLRLPMEEGLSMLHTLGQSQSPELRARGMEAMQKLSVSEADKLAFRHLHDPVWFVRVTSIDILSRSGNATGIPEIARLLLSDPDEVVRSWAAFYLGVVGNTSCISDLERCITTDEGFDHEGTPISEIAAKAIAKIFARP